MRRTSRATVAAELGAQVVGDQEHDVGALRRDSRSRWHGRPRGGGLRALGPSHRSPEPDQAARHQRSTTVAFGVVEHETEKRHPLFLPSPEPAAHRGCLGAIAGFSRILSSALRLCPALAHPPAATAVPHDGLVFDLFRPRG